MFSIFRKEISWRELEFGFIASTAIHYRDHGSLPSPRRIETNVLDLVEGSRKRLSEDQKMILRVAALTVGLFGDWEPLFLAVLTKDGRINSRPYAEISSRLKAKSSGFEAPPDLGEIMRQFRMG